MEKNKKSENPFIHPTQIIVSVPDLNVQDAEYGERGIKKEVKNFPGITLRDHYAGLALQGYCGGEYTGQSGMGHDTIAEWCYGMADAMLEQRLKE